MKKLFLFIILGLFLVIPFASAIQSDIKENYKIGETIITKVSGNFLQNIAKQNIYFYIRHMPTAFPDYDVKKIENDFYIYAKTPLEKIPDNYSIRIKNVRHMEGAKISYQDIILNFTIINETADFSVYPGAIISDIDFYIDVQNLLYENLEINIGTAEQQVSANGEGDGGFFDFLFKKKTTENETTVLTPKIITLIPGEKKKIEFRIEQTEFKIIELSSKNQIYQIIADLTFNYTAVSNKINGTNETILENGTVILNETTTEENKIIIIIDENLSQENKTIFFEKKCVELGGTPCTNGYTCNGTIVNSSTTLESSPCCKGECVAPKTSKTGKIIGIALIIVIVLIIFFVVKKNLRKKKKPVNLLNPGKN